MRNWGDYTGSGSGADHPSPTPCWPCARPLVTTYQPATSSYVRLLDQKHARYAHGVAGSQVLRLYDTDAVVCAPSRLTSPCQITCNWLCSVFVAFTKPKNAVPDLITAIAKWPMVACSGCGDAAHLPWRALSRTARYSCHNHQDLKLWKKALCSLSQADIYV